jgi:hypothetical protein
MSGEERSEPGGADEPRDEEARTVDLSGEVPVPPPPPPEDRTETATVPAPGHPSAASADPGQTFPPTETFTGGEGEPPPVVSGYRPVRLLGEGTFGRVWLYQDERTGIRVAIKFFRHDQGLPWLLLQAEVRQLAVLHADPGIVQLLDVEPDAQPPYYAMSFAPGGSLADRLTGGQRLPVPVALRIFREVVAALAYVHAKRVRHCDLKPGNVLLDGRGRALLADFGQAHLGATDGPALGTYFYMAPEQADLTNTIPDARWDVYGAGALFFAMLTGRPPRESAALRAELSAMPELADRLARYRQAVAGSPRPTEHRRVSGMDRALAAIIDRCLEVDPEKRFRDAGAILDALDARARARRRRPLLLFGLIAPLLLVVALTTWGYSTGLGEVATVQNHLIDQVESDDRASARLVANAVGDSLQERIDHLEAFRKTHGPELARALTRQQAGPEPLRAILKELDNGQENGHALFYQYWVVDRKGFARAGYPERIGQVAAQVGRQPRWAYRDWFSGKGDHPERADDWVPPVEQVHVSQPYVSRVPGKRYLSINVTVPLRAKEPGGEVAGVLTGQIRVADLHAWLRGVNIPDGFVVLLNARGHCLLHRDAGAIRPEEGSNPKDWQEDCPEWRKALSGEADDGTMRYHDPIAGEDFLAGFSRFPAGRGGGRGEWVALVQHRQDAVLGPVEELKAKLFHDCLLALVAGVVVVGSLWGWLFVTLRREPGGT